MFRKFWSMMNKEDSGFTLVELLVVVVIIGVLVAIAVPVFQGVTARANRNTVESNLRIIDGAIQMYNAQEGGFPETEGDPGVGGINDLVPEYLDEVPEGPGDTTYTLIEDGEEGEEQVRAQASIPEEPWANDAGDEEETRRSLRNDYDEDWNDTTT